MPFIEVKTNTAIAKESELAIKSEIAKLLAESFPGKTENWLMLDFAENCRMYFSGSDKPCAMVRIALFGHGSGKSFDKMTAGVCSLIESRLAIPADRVYVKYEEVSHWGWNGGNF